MTSPFDRVSRAWAQRDTCKELANTPGSRILRLQDGGRRIELYTEKSQSFAWAELRSLLSMGQIEDLRNILQVLRLAGLGPQRPARLSDGVLRDARRLNENSCSLL